MTVKKTAKKIREKLTSLKIEKAVSKRQLFYLK
jgi:hypothetical protein